MAIQISDLVVYLSGGATNTDPDASLGGIKSGLTAGIVLSQSGSAPTNVTGVTIVNGYGNPIGNGTLKWDSVQGELLWKPAGGVAFNGPIVASDGTYVLGDSSGFLVVTVVFSSLPGTTQQDSDILIANLSNRVFDSVSAVESTDGLVEYRCLYLHNTHGTDTAYDCRVWIKQQPVGPDSLHIALDPAGKGNGSTTGVAILIDDEEDTGNDLSAIVWTQPATQTTGLVIGNLAPGECHAFWQKRTVPAESTQQVSNDISKIGISALI